MFDRYIFADYSGAGEDDQVNSTISVWECRSAGTPAKIGGTGWSRNSLRREIAKRAQEIDPHTERMLIGFDHQYSWPLFVWQQANLQNCSWRDALRALADGHDDMPHLDIPKRYCAAFNSWAEEPVFWTPLKKRAASYGIPSSRPASTGTAPFRLTEKQFTGGDLKPKPADAVGGMGEGIVGGQTICGMNQIARMLEVKTLAWWPFDGINISDPSYAGKHVAIEIYPSMLRPAGIEQSDDNDGKYSAIAMCEADRSGRLAELLNLERCGMSQIDQRLVRLEGWIAGVVPR